MYKTHPDIESTI